MSERRFDPHKPPGVDDKQRDIGGGGKIACGVVLGRVGEQLAQCLSAFMQPRKNGSRCGHRDKREQTRGEGTHERVALAIETIKCAVYQTLTVLIQEVGPATDVQRLDEGCRRRT